MHGLPAGVPTAVGVAAAILAVLWFMRRLSLRGQFVALVFVSVSIGVLLMTIVQVPRFPGWLAASLVIVVFISMPFAVRRFMRSLSQEDEEEMRKVSHGPTR
ncbi:MAG: hypothetical protein WAK91_14540 [Candidatus Acidiferrales bacterium]|jgi:hypothetical protein